jgi:hypothetical protein
VIDLQQVERMPGWWRVAVYRLGLGILLAATAQVGERQRLEPAPDRAGRWWTQAFLAAAPDDLLDDARSPTSLWRQVAFIRRRAASVAGDTREVFRPPLDLPGSSAVSVPPASRHRRRRV